MIDFLKINPVKTLNQKNDFILAIGHFLFGIAVFYAHFLALIYCCSIFLMGFFYVFQNKDHDYRVLYVSAYWVGAEVFLRMTNATPFYELCRYGLIVLFVVGIFFHHFNVNAKWYFYYLAALVPGLIVGFWVLESPIYSKIVFDFLGPLLLAVASIYCFKKRVRFEDIHQILCFIKWPVFTCAGYLFILNLNSSFLKFNTESNFDITDNYGPNQVATLFGFSVFILCTQLTTQAIKSWYALFNAMAFACMLYLCLLTFSRGGTVVCLIISLIFMVQVYLARNYFFTQNQILLKFGGFFFLGILVFVLATLKTDGLIIKRYANQFSNGKVRSESKYGRRKLAAYELSLFAEHPILGSGLGYGKQNSTNVFGKKISTHNEFSRLLAEHGLFGLLAACLMLCTPLVFYETDKPNLYFWAFYLFWFFTIVHSGLRLALPSFIYALGLLSVQKKN